MAGQAILPFEPVVGVPQFMPVSPSPSPSPSPSAPADIQSALRCGATGMKGTWPITAASDCPAWMRELQR